MAAPVNFQTPPRAAGRQNQQNEQDQRVLQISQRILNNPNVRRVLNFNNPFDLGQIEQALPNN